MSDRAFEDWGDRLLAAARDLPYPPTPDLSTRLREPLRDRRRARTARLRALAWTAAAVIVLVIATILLVPPVRAAVLEFLQVGVVRIFLVEPTPTPTATPAPATETPAMPAATRPPPTPTPYILTSLLDLSGEISLEQALDELEFSILLPSDPPDIGLPDRVYLQDQDGQVLILVWTDPQQPDRAVLSLHAIGAGSWAITKMGPVVVEQTTVNGLEAYWAVGPYPLRLTNGAMDFRRLVQGNVLIWEQDGITYRLECNLSMEEAVQIAESLRPLPRPSPTP